MARPKETIFTRRIDRTNVSEAQLAWLDGYIERQRRERGVKCTRADALRMILAERIAQEQSAVESAT